MFGETANLVANLALTGNFENKLKASQKALGSFDASLSRTEGRAFRAGQQIGTGIKNAAKIAAIGVGLLASQVVLGVRSLSRLEDAVAQTNAVIRSTKRIAGISGDAVRTLAEKYEGLNATIDDTVIQTGENLLLTFTNVRRKAFEPALLAILNLNTALGRGEGGLTNTVRIVAKALNDPLKGLTALQRVGIVFTDKQKDQIKAALKVNDTYKAQQIILAELTKRFGGSFAAAGQTAAGKWKGFLDVIEDLQRTLAKGLLPVIVRVTDILTAKLKDPRIQSAVTDLGVKIAGLFNEKNLAAASSAFDSVFSILRSSAPLLEQVAGGLAKIVKGAISAFRTLPPEIQKIAIAGFAVNKLTGGLLTNIVGGIAGKLFQRGSTPLNPLFVKEVGLGGGLGGAAGAAAGAGAIGTGAAIAAIAAAVAATVISTLPFAERNNQLGDAGLNPAEIEALKYYRSSLAAQQDAVKRLGHIPSKADFDTAMAKLTRAGGDSPALHGTIRHIFTTVAKQLKADIGATRNPDARDPRNRFHRGIPAVARDSWPKGWEQIEDRRTHSIDRVTTAVEKLRSKAAADLNGVKVATRKGSAAVAQAIRRKQLSVKVNTNITARTFINGREVSSNLARYSTVSKYGAVPT